jgi:hypothetical protein
VSYIREIDPNSSSEFSQSQLMFDTINGTIVPMKEATKKPSLCPKIPPGLHGPVKAVTDNVPDTMEELEKLFPYLAPGGVFRPMECVSRHQVLISRTF